MYNPEPIQINLSEDATAQLSNLRKMLALPDDETTVQWAISILENLLKEQNSGAEIRIREPNGKQFRVDFPQGSDRQSRIEEAA